MRTADRELKSSSPTAIYLTELLNRHPEIQQKDISSDLGIGSSTNIMTIFKNGKSKFPIKHIIPLCNILQEDPKEFINIAISEYFPEMLTIIEELKGEVIDSSEKELIRLFRKAKSYRTDEVRTLAVQTLIKEVTDEGRVPSETEMRYAKNLCVEFSKDTKNRSKLSALLRKLFVPIE